MHGGNMYLKMIASLLLSSFFILSHINVCFGSQNIDWIKSNITEININKYTTITFSTQIPADEKLLPNSVILIRCDENGKNISNLGKMYDDNTNGDVLSGDNIFSLNFDIHESKPQYLYFKSSVAYSGIRNRVQSEILKIKIISNDDPDVIKTKIAELLINNDKDNLKKYLGKKTNETLLLFTNDQQKQLGEFISSSKLEEGSDKIRFYRYNIPGSQDNKFYTFVMIKSDLGIWTMTNW